MDTSHVRLEMDTMDDDKRILITLEKDPGDPKYSDTSIMLMDESEGRYIEAKLPLEEWGNLRTVLDKQL